jgi:hypothetical protein
MILVTITFGSPDFSNPHLTPHNPSEKIVFNDPIDQVTFMNGENIFQSPEASAQVTP